MKTLETIINEMEQVKGNFSISSEFGLNACKKEIVWRKEHMNKGYYEQLEAYVNRANNEQGFNDMMVLACWYIINDK